MLKLFKGFKRSKKDKESDKKTDEQSEGDKQTTDTSIPLVEQSHQENEAIATQGEQSEVSSGLSARPQLLQPPHHMMQNPQFAFPHHFHHHQHFGAFGGPPGGPQAFPPPFLPLPQPDEALRSRSNSSRSLQSQRPQPPRGRGGPKKMPPPSMTTQVPAAINPEATGESAQLSNEDALAKETAELGEPEENLDNQGDNREQGENIANGHPQATSNDNQEAVPEAVANVTDIEKKEEPTQEHTGALDHNRVEPEIKEVVSLESSTSSSGPRFAEVTEEPTQRVVTNLRDCTGTASSADEAGGSDKVHAVSEPPPGSRQTAHRVKEIGHGDNKAAKRLVAEKFLTILSQKQYFGKVLKLKNIVVSDVNVTAELSTNYIAVQRTETASSLLYDDLQMQPSDLTSTDEEGLVESRVTMCTIKEGGRHAYVEKEMDAQKLINQSGLKCVFVTEKQALVAQKEHVRPIATLIVVWRPISSPSDDYNCPSHRKPMELYDPVTKDLACALCCAAQGRKMLVLSEVVSPQLQAEIMKLLQSKSSDTLSRIRKIVSAHNHTARVRDRSLASIDEQFSAISQALEAKRRELVDEVTSAFRTPLEDMGASIVQLADVSRLLEASCSALRSTSLEPPQMAIIATAIKSQIPQVADISGSAKQTNINLGHLIDSIQHLGVSDPQRCREVDLKKDDTPRNSITSPKRVKSSPTRPIMPRGVVRDVHRDPFSPLLACKPGTSLFNFPIHDLIQQGDVIEWRLRVEDGGDWLGLGVGVDGSLEGWSSGDPFDLRHLWVSQKNSPKLLLLRASRISNGNAKLSIHKANGAQLDDGRIPHWHVSRTAYPQVSFGGRHGRVLMVSPPMIL